MKLTPNGVVLFSYDQKYKMTDLRVPTSWFKLIKHFISFSIIS